MILSSLRPSPTLTDTELGRSLRLMIWEGVASGALFSLGSGGFMAAFALALLHVTDADGSTAQVEHVVTVNP